MTNTKDEEKPSAKPEERAYNTPVSAALPDTEPHEKIRPHRDPPMLSDTPQISIANSETPHHPHRAHPSGPDGTTRGPPNLKHPASPPRTSLLRGKTNLLLLIVTTCAIPDTSGPHPRSGAGH